MLSLVDLQLWYHATSALALVDFLLWCHVTSVIALVDLLLWYHVTSGIALVDLLLWYHVTSAMTLVDLLLWYHVMSRLVLVDLLLWYHATSIMTTYIVVLQTVSLIFWVYLVVVLFFAVVICDGSRFCLSWIGTLVLLLKHLYLALQSLEFERTWRKLFQKRVVRTKFDIYVLFSRFRLRPVCWLPSVASGTGLSILARLSLSVFVTLISIFQIFEFSCSTYLVVNRINKNP
jgi:hypothetical protein